MVTIRSKLVIVEGLPGTGKSTAAEYISGALTKRGKYAQWYDKADLNHPAEFTFHAFLTNDQIERFPDMERQQLGDECIRMTTGIVVPLIKISVNLFNKVMPYKIYDKLDWELASPVILENWRTFTNGACVGNCTYVFNGCIIDNPMRELFARHGAGYDDIYTYIHALYDTVAQLEPVVVYLRSSDVPTRVREVATSRTIDWLSGEIEWYTSQGYGKRNALSGFDGYVACLEENQRLALQLLDSLPVKKLILDDPFHDWNDAYQSIDDYLDQLV